ncbi:contractile injection system tape measure protein [Mucilaginibacter sp. RS28]|uniref:Contractile injection system tape measure protein n=1 Tax=Mucilaginibacter straminoryzae TaxID=2932774 RepID=A0A9X1WZ60_9SPHI|nr:contractile injection system tape measure protein [Mucilaginibacter straminoryzae]MCJ8208332.1 contractile injection system tape measure protein [Mucilaginibacter straminoryzae]
MGYYHIQRYLFDVTTTGSESEARLLQGQLSNIFNQQVVSRLEALFDRVIPEDVALHINELTIDAGVIPPQLLDTQLVERIIEELEQQLLLLLEENHQQLPGGTTNSPTGQFAADKFGLLTYYLLYGLFPWWAKGFAISSVNKLIEELIHSDEQRLKRIILSIGSRQNVQQRLAWQFSDHTIRKMIAVLEPAEADFIFQYHAEVLYQKRRTNLFTGEASGFSRVIWRFIFSTLLRDGAGRFNRKMFVLYNIRSIAAHFNLAYTRLLDILYASMDSEYFEGTHFEVFGIVKELWNEGRQADTPNPVNDYIGNEDTSTPEAEIWVQQLRIIHYYLFHLSLPPEAKIKDLAELNSNMLRLMRMTPRSVIQLLYELQQLENPGARLAIVFNDGVTEEIIRLIEPTNAVFILEYRTTVNKIQERERPVNIEQASFSRVVWELIFNFILKEHGSEFNRKMFLERNIRALAGHYNLSVANLANILRHRSSALLSTSLLDIFFEVLDRLEEAAIVGTDNTPSTVATVVVKENPARLHNHPVYQRNVLLHIIIHGEVPSWYHGELTVGALVLELAKAASNEFIQLLAYAAHSGTYLLNIYRYIPLAALLEALQQLTGGRKAVQIYQEAVAAIATIGAISMDPERLQRMVFEAFLQTYSSGSWRSFDIRLFLDAVIRKLSLSGGLSEAKVVALLRDATTTQGQSVYLKEALKVIRAVPKGYEFNGSEALILSATGTEWLTTVLDTYHQNNSSSTITYQDTLLHILEFYLKEYRLPPGLGLSADQAMVLLRQIIVVLLRRSPEKLKEVFDGDGNIYARMYLHNLFAITVSAEYMAVRRFLELYLKADAERYITTLTGNSSKEGDQYILRWIDQLLTRKENLSAAERTLLSRISRQQSLAVYLAGHYTDEQIYSLLTLVEQEWGENLVLFLTELTAFLQRAFNVSDQALAARLRTFNLIYFLGSNQRVSARDYIRKLFENFNYYIGNLTEAQLTRLIEAQIAREKVSPGFYQLLPEIKVALLRQMELLTGRAAVARLVAAIGKETRLPPPDQQIIDELKKYKNIGSMQDDELPLPEGDTYLINNAGLVLLHPFLFTFFNRLEMLDGKNFKDENARRWGIHLLQHLVGSDGSVTENELLLNKILVGLPPQEAVEEGIELSDTEKELSEQLLKVVTQQWDKLKNTSIAGLQASFLQRQGSLSITEGNWQLRVEPRAYDLILQTLPWGIGLIKLPWMDTMLHVIWELN